MTEKDKQVIDEGTKVVKNIGVVTGAAIGYLKKLDIDGAKDDEKHANTDYSKFGGLKHFLYAGFAQLSYLNWHKLVKYQSGENLKTIIDDKIAYDEIRPDFDVSLYGSLFKNKDYLYVIKGKDTKEIKIYNADDRRGLYLYSEHPTDPQENPKFPEFKDWEFVYAYDHNKILDTMDGIVEEYKSIRGNIADKITKTLEDCLYNTEKPKGIVTLKKGAKIGNTNSNFQASVFKNPKTKAVMIAYRGTDATHLLDWTLTNISLKLNWIPDALTCAVWVYEKVATDPNLRDYNIHVTGHSMGGALAQYIACYGLKPVTPTVYEDYAIDDKEKKNKLKNESLTRPVYKTVTWNGLGIVGIGGKEKHSTDKHKKVHSNVYEANYNYCVTCTDKILNFYMQKDFVSDLAPGLGMKVLVDYKKTDDIAFKDSPGAYHGFGSFLPYIDRSGNIVRNKLSKNFMSNAFKQAMFDEGKKKSIKTMRKVPAGYASVTIDKVENESYLEKDFDISFMDYETQLGNIYDNLADKKKSGGNLFYYMMKHNSDPERTDWYSIGKTPDKKEYTEIGMFNNMGNIAGVEGGAPLRIALPEEAVLSPVAEEQLGINYNELKPSYSVSGFKFLNFKKFRLSAGMNKHNSLLIEGEVSEEEFKKYIKKDYLFDEVTITAFGLNDKNNEEQSSESDQSNNTKEEFSKVLLNGIISNIRFAKKLSEKSEIIYVVKLFIKSYSYLLDIKKEKRIYQNKITTYKSIFEEIEKCSNAIKIGILEETKIGNYYLQYEETDWQFIKRLASNLGKPVILERTKGENLQNATIGYFSKGENEVFKEFEELSDKITHRYGKKAYKIFQCDEILRIGEYINLYKSGETPEPKVAQAEREKRNSSHTKVPGYFVHSMLAILKDNELQYYYKLVANNDDNRIINPKYNKVLAGRSIKAKVENLVQIYAIKEKMFTNGYFIDLDFTIPNGNGIEEIINSEKREDYYLFPMTYSYGSAKNGTCFVPDKGDTVMVYFPDCWEISGIINNSRREPQEFCKDLHKPDDKSIAVDTGQGIIVSKTNGTTVYGNSITDKGANKVSINAFDKGIKVLSDGEAVSITLNSSALNFTKNDSILKLNSDNILIKNGGSEISIKADSIKVNSMNISSSEIAVKGKIINN